MEYCELGIIFITELIEEFGCVQECFWKAKWWWLG